MAYAAATSGLSTTTASTSGQTPQACSSTFRSPNFSPWSPSSPVTPTFGTLPPLLRSTSSSRLGSASGAKSPTFQLYHHHHGVSRTSPRIPNLIHRNSPDLQPHPYPAPSHHLPKPLQCRPVSPLALTLESQPWYGTDLPFALGSPTLRHQMPEWVQRGYPSPQYMSQAIEEESNRRLHQQHQQQQKELNARDVKLATPRRASHDEAARRAGSVPLPTLASISAVGTRSSASARKAGVRHSARATVGLGIDALLPASDPGLSIGATTAVGTRKKRSHDDADYSEPQPRPVEHYSNGPGFRSTASTVSPHRRASRHWSAAYARFYDHFVWKPHGGPLHRKKLRVAYHSARQVVRAASAAAAAAAVSSSSSPRSSKSMSYETILAHSSHPQSTVLGRTSAEPGSLSRADTSTSTRSSKRLRTERQSISRHQAASSLDEELLALAGVSPAVATSSTSTTTAAAKDSLRFPAAVLPATGRLTSQPPLRDFQPSPRFYPAEFQFAKNKTDVYTPPYVRVGRVPERGGRKTPSADSGINSVAGVASANEAGSTSGSGAFIKGSKEGWCGLCSFTDGPGPLTRAGSTSRILATGELLVLSPASASFLWISQSSLLSSASRSYHMVRVHGISPRTLRPFRAPAELRRPKKRFTKTDADGEVVENDTIEGKCSVCR